MILPRRRKRESFLPWLFLLVDAVSIQLLLRAAFWFRFSKGFFETSLSPTDYPIYYRSFILMMFMLLFFLRFYGLYRSAKLLTFPEEVARILKAVTASCSVLLVLTFFYRDFSYSRTYVVIAGVTLAAGLSFERFVLGLFILWVDRRRGSLRNVLVIGIDEHARKLIHFYKRHPRLGTRVVGFLDDRWPKEKSVDGVGVWGRPDELRRFLRSEHQVHEVVLAEKDWPSEKVLKVIYECEKKMVAFRWVTDIFGLITSKMQVSYLGGVSLLSFTDSPLSDLENRFLKRAMDLSLSFCALLFLLPVGLVLAALVKMDSPGPVFYRQLRIGADRRRFRLLKFRTMRSDAEKESGPVWARENDPRRTRLGVFLRENNLDELPQLWNVLMGDMSLVGPRPERPFFVSRFKQDIPRYMARHTIKSGITGWAQVNGLRGNTSIGERTKFDLYYIENWSVWFDLKILFLTLFARKNAY